MPDIHHTWQATILRTEACGRVKGKHLRRKIDLVDCLVCLRIWEEVVTKNLLNMLNHLEKIL